MHNNDIVNAQNKQINDYVFNSTQENGIGREIEQVWIIKITDAISAYHEKNNRKKTAENNKIKAVIRVCCVLSVPINRCDSYFCKMCENRKCLCVCCASPNLKN